VNESCDELRARLSKIEREHVVLLARSTEAKVRYASVLQMMRGLTANALRGSLRAAAASEKSLIAVQQAVTAAKEAALNGSLELAEAALAVAKTAADAAAEAAQASVEAWKAALVASGHNAETELLAMSAKARDASKAANASARAALDVFTDAFDRVKATASHQEQGLPVTTNRGPAVSGRRREQSPGLYDNLGA
jgi:hypothetical protein